MRGSFEPYLPRLVRDWSQDGRLGLRELDGTLVSLDISGFTALSERLQAKGRAGAEELVLLVSGVFQSLIGICERRGGDVLKFRGDALLLFFDGPEHAQRAATAAAEMQWLIGVTGETMSSVGAVTLRMSTGIHSGACHFFLVEGTHRELVVTGPAATATILLESEANAGEILVGPDTAAALDPASLGEERAGARLLRDMAIDDDVADVVAHLALTARDLELEPYVPEPLRAQLVLSAGEAEHRHVTAAFVKYSGVDGALAEGRGEEIYAQLSELARVTGETCADLGVTWLESDIDKDGGKLYLVAGAPATTGEDEERMLRALRTIVETDCGLALRAGANHGPAFCGDIGSETRRTYAVMGDTVNLGARLVARADEGHLLVTAGVLERARTRFASQPQPFLMKGKAEPITAYTVGEPTGVRDEEQTVELPLVGRQRELDAFADAINASRLRQQRLVEIVGDPGIGKSRLVEELKRQSLGFAQFVARCDPYAASNPYFVLRALLRPLAGITPDLDEEAAGGHLAPWVQATMPDLAPWLPLLAVPFGAEVAPTPETEQIDANFRRERLHDVVEQFLTRVLMMPALIVFEDAHWMDDASHELVRHLTRTAAPRPWLVCVTRRPQGTLLAADVDGHALIDLQPLGGDDAQALALAAAGELALSSDALDVVRDRSGGNPLFVRELIAAARGAGSVDELPQTVETLITTRMDTLPPEDRFLLRNASVLGARFDLSLVAEILSDELENVDDMARWERLAEFVRWSGSSELHFVHDLFRVVAYQGLSFRRRKDVHARVADALERRRAEPALLSLHFSEAERFEKAWEYAVSAGDRARAGFANVVAAELYERALAAAEHLDLAAEDVARVWEALGDVAELFADYEKALAAYARGRSLASSDSERARFMLKEGTVRERNGDYAEALTRYEEALALADAALLPDVEVAYGGVLFRQAQYEEAIGWCKRAAEHAEAAGRRATVAHAYFVLDAANTHLGRLEPEWTEQALAIYDELGDALGASKVLNNLGIHAYYAGRWDEALDFYRRSRAAKQRAGDVVAAAILLNNEGEILADQGHYGDAQELFDDALRICRAAHYALGEAFVKANLARLAARTVRFAEAHALFDEARAQLEEIGSHGLALEVDARRAECLVFEGRHREAAELAAAALERSEGLGRRGTLGPLLERLVGYALHQDRRPAEARPHFEESLRLARDAGADYDVALTLRALADTGGADGKEAEEIFARLGIVATPSVPLP